MKLHCIYNSRLVRKGYNAWVLFPFVFFRASQEDVTDRLFRHEMEHIYQVLRMGWWRFYITYLLHLRRYGYAKHPYEIQAREREHDPLTTTERYWKDL